MDSRADFGPLVLSTDVDDAVVDTLLTWLPTYLFQFEHERGLTPGTLARPAASSISTTLTDDEFPDHMLPSTLVSTAATAGPPKILGGHGGGEQIECVWHTIVSCVVRGRRPLETRQSAARLEGCVRRLLTQQAGLGDLGKASGLRAKWIGSNVVPVSDRTAAGRYLAAGIAQFHVSCNVAVQRGYMGPRVPETLDAPYLPYPPLARVVEIDVDVEGLPPGTGPRSEGDD